MNELIRWSSIVLHGIFFSCSRTWDRNWRRPALVLKLLFELFMWKTSLSVSRVRLFSLWFNRLATIHSFSEEYRVSLKKWWGVCTWFLVFYRLKFYLLTYLFHTQTKYVTILSYPGLYSSLTDEKWAYGRSLEIIHYKGQRFMFFKIFIQFVCLFMCIGCGVADVVRV